MKTYTAFSGCMAVFLVIACSTSTIDEPTDNIDPPGVNTGLVAEYTIVLEDTNGYSSELLRTDLTKVIGDGAVPISSIGAVQLTYNDASSMSFYRKAEDCSHEMMVYDFEQESAKAIALLSDKADCNLIVNSIAHSNGTAFAGYTIPGSGPNEELFFIRKQRAGNDFTDIPLSSRPLSLLFAKNRIFVFAVNENTTDNVLVVVNTNTNAIEETINLGQNALQQFLNREGNIIVAYDELHLEISTQTLETITQVRYNADVAPNFARTVSIFFDGDTLYFQRSSETGIPEIPALYNFDSNSTTLYFYENFLTTEQLQTRFKIGTTSMVAYDNKNDLILIGYQKSDNSNRGGLLRIDPSREIAFLDNTDFDGVPSHLYVR